MFDVKTYIDKKHMASSIKKWFDLKLMTSKHALKKKRGCKKKEVVILIVVIKKKVVK